MSLFFDTSRNYIICIGFLSECNVFPQTENQGFYYQIARFHNNFRLQQHPILRSSMLVNQKNKDGCSRSTFTCTCIQKHMSHIWITSDPINSLIPFLIIPTIYNFTTTRNFRGIIHRHISISISYK